ncbi:DUF1674 domain-containing protein [Pacificispira sp.]|uniref:DUF1674 domain-containing protein n=1 Tax=Pacificispira sp. TaxID=2888761 RepID=UPI002EA2A4B7|nr:DUF1674 domain-containing protein [Pseudomonadota bacterium]
MTKLSNLFKASKPKQPRLPTAEELPEGVAPDDLKGVDERRLAELKAEAAGERARKAAEQAGAGGGEVGGPKGLEPTRYGDWEKAGRCFDF